MTRPESYIGISGVVSPVQQCHAEHLAETLEFSQLNRRLLLGVKAVHKTQYLDIENKYGHEWYPVGSQPFVHALWPRSTDSRSLAVAQAFFEPAEVGDAGYRQAFAERIFSRGAAWIDGIQFDMLPWHTSDDMLRFLEELKEKYATKILLQAHAPAMTELGPAGVPRRLGRYAAAVDYVLFDSSHGTGKRLNVDALADFLDAAYSSSNLDHAGFAIAGGLNGDIVREELPALLERYPDVSWDAEGQLHPVNAKGTRPLDFTLTQQYLEASAEVIRQTR